MLAVPNLGDIPVTQTLVTLAFGSSLLPSLAVANKAALGTLLDTQPELVEPTRGSIAGSPPLKCAALLAYPAPLLLDDVVDVVGRMNQLDESELSRLLESRKQQGKLVRKAEFEASVSQMPPASAPLLCSRDGSPMGVLPPQTATSGAPAPAPLALAATWAAISGGSPYVAPQEVERVLQRWRPDAEVFALDEFEKNLVQGRAAVALGYGILFGMQALVAVLFVLQPLLAYVSGGAAT